MFDNRSELKKIISEQILIALINSITILFSGILMTHPYVGILFASTKMSISPGMHGYVNERNIYIINNPS